MIYWTETILKPVNFQNDKELVKYNKNFKILRYVLQSLNYKVDKLIKNKI